MANPEDDLHLKNDRELMLAQVKSQYRTERYIERIKNNVIFWFYLGLVGFVIFIFSLL